VVAFHRRIRHLCILHSPSGHSVRITVPLQLRAECPLCRILCSRIVRIAQPDACPQNPAPDADPAPGNTGSISPLYFGRSFVSDRRVRPERHQRAYCVSCRSSLLVPCPGASILTVCARYDRRLDVHVDLLADEKRGTLSRNSIDHLKNAGIYAFGVIARERFLGDDIGLKADELQRDFERTISPRRSHCWRAFAHARRIVLINVHANVQGRDASEDHQRFTERAALCVLSESHFVLQNGPLDWGTSRQPLDIDFVLMKGSLRLRDLSTGNLQVWPPGPSFGQRQVLLRLREASLSCLVIVAPAKHVLFLHRPAV